MKRILILIAAVSISLSLSLPARAASQPAESPSGDPAGLASTDYDNVYLEEKRAPALPWKIGASVGSEFGDAYLNMQSANITALRTIGTSEYRRYMAVGVSVNKFFAQDASLTQTLNNSQIVSISPAKPVFSGFGVFEVTPFQGNMNFISQDPLDLALSLRLGAGAMYYQGNQSYPAAMWSLCPEIGVTRNVGIEISAGQEIESPFNGGSRVARWIGQAGAYVRF